MRRCEASAGGATARRVVETALLRTLCVLAVGTVGCSGARPPSSSRSLSVERLGVISGGNVVPLLVETSSVAIPASAKMAECPGGRAFISASDYNGAGSGVLYSKSLDCVGEQGCFTKAPNGADGGEAPGVFALQRSPAPEPSGRCANGVVPVTSDLLHTYPTGRIGTDEMMARTRVVRPDGRSVMRVLHMWQGVIQSAPDYPYVDSSEWRARGVSGPPPPPRCNAPYVSVGLFFRHSDDCGESWSAPSTVDFRTIAQPDGTSFGMTPVEKGALVVRESGEVFGTDRPEIYVDPFAGHRVYAGVNLALPTGRFDVVARSEDGGDSWDIAHRFADYGGGAKVMTTTRDDALFLVRCIGTADSLGNYVQRNSLHWFDRKGTHAAGQAFIDYQLDAYRVECRGVSPDHLVGHVANMGDTTLARLVTHGNADDRIRVLYSGVVDSSTRQSLFGVRVTVSRDPKCWAGVTPTPAGCVRVENEVLLDGAPSHSILQAHLAQLDGFDGNDLESGVLGYLVWPRDEGVVSARARVLGTDGLSPEAALGPSWRPYPGAFIGDYNYGTVYSTPEHGRGAFAYFGQWPAPAPGIDRPNGFLRARIVSVSPLNSL